MSVDEGTARGVELDQAIRTLIEGSEEAARAYLKQVWLSRAMDALGRARKGAGLTQAQLAERLGTTQSAVARVENDDDGGISLRRYVDYALACGAFLPDLELVPLADVLAYATAKPSAPRTGMDLALWKIMQEAAMGHAAARGCGDVYSSRAAGPGVATDSIATQAWEQSVTGQHVLFQDCPPRREPYCPASRSQSSTERTATRQVSQPVQSQFAENRVAEDQKVAA